MVKRFVYDGVNIFDNETGEYILTVWDIVRLLNELNDKYEDEKELVNQMNSFNNLQGGY